MSLAWCPKCEHLTNDVSTPCFQCGSALEYATVEEPSISGDNIQNVKITHTVVDTSPDDSALTGTEEGD